MNIRDAQTCPFGGSNKDDIKIKTTRRGGQLSRGPWYRVVCTCGLSGPWAPLIDSAIIEWNQITLK